jgi:hypothetical protein
MLEDADSCSLHSISNKKPRASPEAFDENKAVTGSTPVGRWQRLYPITTPVSSFRRAQTPGFAPSEHALGVLGIVKPSRQRKKP